jgi:RNA polymerase sigma factor (sigma-70 family)
MILRGKPQRASSPENGASRGEPDRTGADEELVRRVRAGDARARVEFLRRVTNVVRHRVGRVLSAAARRQPNTTLRRQDLLDLMQDVFVVLLDRQARVLAAWDPARGLTLESFVGLIAEREALTFRRSGRRSAWAEHPTADVADDSCKLASPEEQAAAKEHLELLLDYLSERLSPRGTLVFEALYVANTPVDEICARFAMTPVAVYSFKTRLKQLIAGFRDSVDSASEDTDVRRVSSRDLAGESSE